MGWGVTNGLVLFSWDGLEIDGGPFRGSGLARNGMMNVENCQMHIAT